MERSKKSAFSLAELMITLLILSIVLSAVMPAVTKRNAGQESVWRWLYDGSHAYFGTGPKQEALIGMAVKPNMDGLTVPDYNTMEKNLSTGEYTAITDADEKKKFALSDIGDRLLLMKYTYKDPDGAMFHPMSNSHITFFSTTFNDAGDEETPHYAGRLAFDETNIAIGRYTFAKIPNKIETSVSDSDGSYQDFPGNINRTNNLALGQFTLYSLASGYENLAVGNESLYSNTRGYRNVALGFQSLIHNVSGYENNALGYQALFKNRNGIGNNAVGHQAGFGIVTGYANTAIGSYSMKENYESGAAGTAFLNTGVGYGALYKSAASNNNTAVGALSGNENIGDKNVFVGSYSGFKNAGYENVMIGYSAGTSDAASGSYNVFIGALAGQTNTTGNYGVFIGSESSRSNTTGLDNIAIGHQSNYMNSQGSNNVIIGHQAGYSNLSDSNTIVGYQAGQNAYSTNNAFFGYQAGQNDTEGGNNTFVGYQAGQNIGNGSGNVFIGYQAGIGANNLFNRLVISNGSDLITGQFPQSSDETASNLTTLAYTTDMKSTITNIGPNEEQPLLRANSAEAKVTIGGLLTGSDGNALKVDKLAGDGSPIEVTGGMRVDSLTVTNSFTPPASWHPWTSSDKRLKNIKGSAEKGLSAVDEMNIVKYTYKNDETKQEHVGVIAQELQKILPAAVKARPDGFLSIDIQDIMFTIAKAVQELHQAVLDLAKEVKALAVKVTTNSQKIEALEKENASLKQQINDLDARLKKLEQAK